MLINLINNGIKAQPNGGRVSLRGWATSEGVTVMVADRGAGMDEAAKHRALEGEGGGRGLSIVRRLLAQNGGSMSIDSTPGQGTQVILTFHGTGGTYEV
jgi:signal transduction histidine kinase